MGQLFGSNLPYVTFHPSLLTSSTRPPRPDGKPKAPSGAGPAPTDDLSASALASQLGGLALGSDDKNPQPAVSRKTLVGGSGNPPAAAGGGEAGPSSSSAARSSSSTSAPLAAPTPPQDDDPIPELPAERMCASCTLVITRKVYRCSRCGLVTYCGKDCQASALYGL